MEKARAELKRALELNVSFEGAELARALLAEMK